MADYTQTVSLADYKLGDYWIGVSAIGPVTINGETPANDLTRVRMTFRLGQITYTLDSADSQGITIDDAGGWSASIAAREEFLPRAGIWSWNLEFWQDGVSAPWTLYAGTLRVWDDVD